jgi:hypothetical protein
LEVKPMTTAYVDTIDRSVEQAPAWLKLVAEQRVAP